MPFSQLLMHLTAPCLFVLAATDLAFTAKAQYLEDRVQHGLGRALSKITRLVTALAASLFDPRSARLARHGQTRFVADGDEQPGVTCESRLIWADVSSMPVRTLAV